jgi:tRNA G37 N-methylase Trm5
MSTTTTLSITGTLRRRHNDFSNSKTQCLGKRDKSFAGRIDPKAVDICAVINERDDCYTTSSCAGRCFIYRGAGIKATTTFARFRISHDLIHDPVRYFDLTTLDSDPTGGGDPIRTIGQYDHQQQHQQPQIGEVQSEQNDEPAQVTDLEAIHASSEENNEDDLANNSRWNSEKEEDKTLWLRFEPFILHVACRSLDSASALMSAARPVFKNVGLTTWKDENKYLVAIWGDEGLEMPLCTPTGQSIFSPAPESDSTSISSGGSIPAWLATLVNERHQRNWTKIRKFVHSVREMKPPSDERYNTTEEEQDSWEENPTLSSSLVSPPSDAIIPKSFDVIGDVAYLHSLPEGGRDHQQQIGDAIMKKNKAIKLVVARQSTLNGTERAPGADGLAIIAGVQRSPLVTTHVEYGIKCVVDLEHTFFSPRMGRERLRICQQVARGEHVLVLFAGVGMEALQIAGRTEAATVVAVELNVVAVTCAQRAHRMLERNKSVKCAGAAERLQIIHGDVLDIVPNQLPRDHYDRILAPRPKEGSLDGDLGTGDGGVGFLDMCLFHLKQDGGECHWYDFVADHEFPDCERTKRLLETTCHKHGLTMDVLHVTNAGSVAMRQLRVCVDFKVSRQ